LQFIFKISNNCCELNVQRQICHVTDIEYEKKLNNIKENTTIEMMEIPNPKLYRTTILM